MLETTDKTIMDWLTWACGTLVAYVVHDTRKKMADNTSAVASLHEQLNAVKTEAAAEKARREETAKSLEKIELAIERGFQRLHDKLDQKEDKQ